MRCPGALADVGSVMFLIALSAIFSYGIVFERVPEVVSGWITGATENLYAVMILIALFIIVVGFFIDATILIIMLTPIFLPLVRQLGGDPVHFGIVFIVAATIGNFTPPVGAAMYAVCSIMKCPIGAYTRESLPLLAAVAIVNAGADLRARLRPVCPQPGVRVLGRGAIGTQLHAGYLVACRAGWDSMRRHSASVRARRSDHSFSELESHLQALVQCLLHRRNQTPRSADRSSQDDPWLPFQFTCGSPLFDPRANLVFTAMQWFSVLAIQVGGLSNAPCTSRRMGCGLRVSTCRSCARLHRACSDRLE